jgi:hypothetical protein
LSTRLNHGNESASVPSKSNIASRSFFTRVTGLTVQALPLLLISG